jgi:hypothetical protein
VTAAWIAAVTAAAVALLSAFLSYLTTRRLSLRGSQLAFIERQLGELYGPLLALSKASGAAWAEFQKNYGVNRLEHPAESASPTDAYIRAWRYWVLNAFMPINRKMFDIILAKTDLIQGEEMPVSFIDFCAHVAGYEVTLAQWADNDYSNLASVINYPSQALRDDIDETYRALKRRQRLLLEYGGNKFIVPPLRWKRPTSEPRPGVRNEALQVGPVMPQPDVTGSPSAAVRETR